MADECAAKVSGTKHHGEKQVLSNGKTEVFVREKVDSSLDDGEREALDESQHQYCADSLHGQPLV